MKENKNPPRGQEGKKEKKREKEEGIKLEKKK
jgi:hypothetical protein